MSTVGIRGSDIFPAADVRDEYHQIHILRRRNGSELMEDVFDVEKMESGSSSNWSPSFSLSLDPLDPPMFCYSKWIWALLHLEALGPHEDFSLFPIEGSRSIFFTPQPQLPPVPSCDLGVPLSFVSLIAPPCHRAHLLHPAVNYGAELQTGTQLGFENALEQGGNSLRGGGDDSKKNTPGTVAHSVQSHPAQVGVTDNLRGWMGTSQSHFPVPVKLPQ
ncbi:unnamed protein product [Pleuronectes platessa]|uniref:Uncharacterized protein n=1 Tax=Pleuronectes platessa TaxID=8262 RepID=A0A9N7UG14_PLEPL|nr:unnamed protein product [Pleuronectes platessa]